MERGDWPTNRPRRLGWLRGGGIPFAPDSYLTGSRGAVAWGPGPIGSSSSSRYGGHMESFIFLAKRTGFGGDGTGEVEVGGVTTILVPSEDHLDRVWIVMYARIDGGPAEVGTRHTYSYGLVD